MTSRKLPFFALLILALLGAGCSTKVADKGTSSLSPAAQTDKPSLPPDKAPSSAPPANTQSTTAGPEATPQEKGKEKDKAISYATNPERFVKYPASPVPFNITDPKTAQEHFNVGVNLDNQKDFAKAVMEYQKAVELKPDWALAYARLAHDDDRLGHTDDAIAHWQQAVKYDPQYYSGYDSLAADYERQGNIRKAIEAYSPLLAYPPAQMPVHYQLGLWYEQIGDHQNAREHLEQYRELARKVKAEQESPRFQTATRELQKIGQ